MNDELATEGLPLAIRILGINPVGYEAGNTAICSGRDLPWLQETGGTPVETAWEANYRDVVILDADNHRLATYNLTAHDLGDPSNYQALKELLRNAASAP